jgi:hypothetical protein
MVLHRPVELAALIGTYPHLVAHSEQTVLRARMRYNEAETVLLIEIFPLLAQELEQLLVKKGELELAAQVPRLAIVDRCRCGDDFCSSFYTQPKPEGKYGPDYRCIELDPAQGMLLLDVVVGAIAHVEVLSHGRIREKLIAAFP